jgi:uncharacterized protein
VSINIARGLSLPLEVATQSIGLYAVKGAGKTYAAAVLAEEMIQAGVQVVVVDPTDVWWGLRSSADGKGDGFPVYVFGGPHADVPLEPTAGELIADVIVDHGINAILSLRHMRKADQHRFFTAFAERLYFRKGEPDKRTPLHLFIDEAHAFAPQVVQGETARMVGAVEDLIRLGRSSGLGASLISQRPASVNNNVRSQCETLIALRIMAPHDRKALKEWFDANDDAGHAAQFMASSASMKTGDAWVFSPPLDIFERVTIRRRSTFDSSATPKPGQQRIEPRRLTEVDVAALGTRISETLERQKAEDPKALRARIAELEARKPDNGEAETLRGDVRALRQIIDDQNRLIRGMVEFYDEGGKLAADLRATLSAAPEKAPTPIRADVAQPAAQRAPNPKVEGSSPSVRASTPTGLSKAERAILGALGTTDRSAQQVAVLSGYKAGTGGFNNAISALRTKGLLEGSAALLRLTQEGKAAAVAYAPALPRPGQERVEYWASHHAVKKVASAVKILRCIAEVYPGALYVTEIAERTGYTPGTGGFNNGLSRLRALDLATSPASGTLRAADSLFEEV